MLDHGRHAGYDYALLIESASATGQDRATVVPTTDGLIIALADGAGGTGSGAKAAEAAIDGVRGLTSVDPEALLRELDDPGRLGRGESTAVVIAIQGTALRGASIGDSGAWLIGTEGIVDLTHDQQRKPLLGAGCTPVGFATTFPGGSTLLIASDGLLRYAKPAAIARLASGDNLERAASTLVDLVRLPTGRLQDDVSIVLCRK
jgi:serine/threonine protein phosphatase PrpC